MITLMFIALSLLSPFSLTVYADWTIDTPTEVETPTEVDTPTKVETPTKSHTKTEAKKETPPNGDGHSGVSWTDAGKYAFRATKQVKDWLIGNKEVIDGWNEAVELRRQGQIPSREWNSHLVNEKFYKLDSKLRRGLAKDALKTGLGLYLPTHGDRKSNVQVGMDVLTGINNGKDAYGYFKKAKAAQKATQEITKGIEVAGEVSNVASKAGFGSKILTKANPVLSVVGTGIAAYDTYNNFQKGDWLGVTSGVGDVLMSAAPLVAAAFPPVAAGMAIAGAALWIGAKTVQHWDSIKKIATDPIGSAKEAWGDTKKAVSNAAKDVANTAKKAWNKVTSWF